MIYFLNRSILFILSDTKNDFIEDTNDDEIYRVSGAGHFVGLEAYLRIRTTEYVSYANSFYGVSVMIHSYDDYPQLSNRVAIVQPGDGVRMIVEPTVVVTDVSVRSLLLRQRNCYFEDERQLETSNRYTYDLCISECTVRTILELCDCLPFYYPEVRE